MELMDEEERQRWWLSVMQQAVASQSDYEDDSSSVLERGRLAASSRRKLRVPGDGDSYGVSSPGSLSLSPSALFAERDQLRQSLMDLETKVADLEGSRFEPPELEELQVLCSTLESQKRSLEQELSQLREEKVRRPELDMADREFSEKLESLEQENSKLVDDLCKERSDHSRAEAELEMEKGRLKELQGQLSLLKADYEQKFQTVDSVDSEKAEKVGVGATDGGQSDRMETMALELQNSRLQDDLFRERHHRSRVEAELQEAQEQLSRLKADYDEKFQTFDSEKAEKVGVGATDGGQSDRMETMALELQNSRLQDDLFRERHHRSRVEAELQEAQEQLSLLKADHDEKFQTFDSEKKVDARPSLQVKVEELERENQRLQEENLAQKLASKAMDEAQDELERQVGHASEAKDGSANLLVPRPRHSELQELLAIDSPGVYVVSQTVTLTVGPEKNSAKIQNLNVGTALNILEVVQRLDDRRVRGRVEEPAGWISIVGTEDAKRWAVRDLQRSNQWACGRAEQLQSLQRELDASQASTSEAHLAQQSQADLATRSRQDLETLQAEAAEDLNRREREVHELQEKQRKLELQLQQAQLQSDSPGIYVLSGDVDVCASAARHSQKVGRLTAGQEIQVEEVIHLEHEKRVRGRVLLDGIEGWISLLDTSTVNGHRWAHRQLAATAEWIRELRARPLQGVTAEGPSELLELRARCAGLEAQRDSLLNELNGLNVNAAERATSGGANGTAELQELRAKVMLLEASREEVMLQAELLKTQHAALQAEHEGLQHYLAEVHETSAAARGRALQVEELQRQVNEQVLERSQLEAELARLRAEHGALTETPLVAKNPLAQAEQWVLYTEIPKVEQTPSLSYLGHIHVDFDDEELTKTLGPLAAVNFAQRVSALAALERGDVARLALKTYCQQDVNSGGYLDAAGVHSFIASVFQSQGLTPPMTAHMSTFWRLFSSNDRLDARGCLCLCDALLRAVLRASGRAAVRVAKPPPVPPVPPVPEPLAWTWTEPREEQGQVVPAPERCRACGAEFEEDAVFCTNCGARRPVAPTDQPPARSTVRPDPGSMLQIPPALRSVSSQGRLQALPPQVMPPSACQAETPDFCPRTCGQRYLAPPAPAPAPPVQAAAPRSLVSPRCLDQSRIRTCRPVAAEMSAPAPAQTPVPATVPPVVPGPPVTVQYVLSK